MSTPDPADPFASPSPTDAAPAPAPAPAVVTARKSLFKNRNRGAAAPATTTDAIGFFSRAKDVFAENVEVQRREREREKEVEREREVERQLEREQERVKRERVVEKVESRGGESEDERRRKRSRSGNRSATPNSGSEYGYDEPSRSIERAGSTPSIASPGPSQRNTRSQAHIISLDSDSEDDHNTAPSPRAPYTSAFSSPPPKPVSAPIAIPSSPDPHPPSDDDELYAELIAAARRAPATTTTAGAAAAAAPDPTLTILITSALPNTTPLLIRRRLSQRLKDVRLAWCSRQPSYAGAAAASVFLTYRGLRVWDTSTCGSMGVKINRAGGVLDDDGGGGGEGGDVHLEAWTREAFEEFKAGEEARARDLAMGVVGGGDGGAGVQEEVVVVEEKAQEEKLRIILRAKDMPEVKLRVKATTKIADLVAAFRAQRETEVAGRGVELWFDGDRMEEEDCVGDADLEDLSGVDVVVR